MCHAPVKCCLFWLSKKGVGTPCEALSQNLSLYDHMFMKTDVSDMQDGSPVEHFLLFYMDISVYDTGVAAFSYT